MWFEEQENKQTNKNKTIHTNAQTNKENEAIGALKDWRPVRCWSEMAGCSRPL